MTEVTFREAVLDDVPAIVRLLADDPLGASRESAPAPLGDASTGLPDAYAAAFAAVERDVNQLLVVGEVGGTVVATMQVSFIPGLSRRGAWRAQIEAVRVDASMRGGGIGEQLVAYALAQARQRGCALVQLTSDRSRTDAHRFYERLGFQPSHVGMKLTLDSPPGGKEA